MSKVRIYCEAVFVVSVVAVALLTCATSSKTP